MIEWKFLKAYLALRLISTLRQEACELILLTWKQCYWLLFSEMKFQSGKVPQGADAGKQAKEATS